MSFHLLQSVNRKSRLLAFKLENLGKEKFECPVCHYTGPFGDIQRPTGLRKHAVCPQCGALERHRHQYLVAQTVLKGMDASKMKMIHFAPEDCLKTFFLQRIGVYETADLDMEGVDHHVDLQNLPFADSTYDFVFASHVMVCIPDDRRAMREIRRVLKPGGVAILPDPVASGTTIEYPEPNPYEGYTMRAPGLDYFDRYKPYFSQVITYSSTFWPEKYQVFEYEDRRRFPSPECPLRPPMTGERHLDMIPVCYA